MSNEKSADKINEASENITIEFQRKGFLPSDAIYVLFRTFMNVSISCGCPIVCLNQMYSYLSKWFDLIYDNGELGKLEEDFCHKLLKTLDLRRMKIEE